MIINRIGPERLLSYRVIVFLSAVIIAIALGMMVSRSPVAGIEAKTEDSLARLATKPARADVVILALDDASVKKYGPVKSWPRNVLAAGLKKVEKSGAKWVVMDLALDKRTHNAEDSALWREMANNRNVVLGMSYDATGKATYTPDDIRSLVFLEKYALADNLTFAASTPQFPYALFEPPVSDFTGSSRGVGVFDRETEPDGTVRAARLVYLSKVEYPAASSSLRGKFPQSQLADGAPIALPNIALVAALRGFGLDKDRVHLTTGATLSVSGNVNPAVNVPIDDEGRMLIRYYGAPGHYTQYSFADLMNGKVPDDAFKGKTVLIGATAANDDATDPRATPMTGRMPRVEITANAISTLLDRSYYSRFPHRVLGIMLIVGVIAGLSLMFFSAGRAAAVTLLLLAVYGGLAYGLYSMGHTMLPLVPGFATILVPFLMGLLLYIGPMRPTPIMASETYVPPPTTAVR